MTGEARAGSETQGYFSSHHLRAEGAAPQSHVIFVISSHQTVTLQTRFKKRNLQNVPGRMSRFRNSPIPGLRLHHSR